MFFSCSGYIKSLKKLKTGLGYTSIHYFGYIPVGISLFKFIKMNDHDMESSPPPGRWGGGGGWCNFMRPWGTLNFHLPLGGLSQIGGLKFSIRLWGQQRFLYWGDGGSPSPTGQKLLIPPTRKSLPSRLLPPTFYSLTKVLSPPTH